MSKYNWLKYNKINSSLSSRMIRFNKINNINFIEIGLYNHIRDIFCLTILFNKNKKKKTKILDYGSNLLALSNISSKINVKLFDFSIFDPFNSKKLNNSKVPFKINLITDRKKLKYRNFDIINFGSILQYIEDINSLNDHINYKNVNTILITHTPFTLLKRYSSKQKNHKNLIQYIRSINEIKRYFKKNGFKMIFKSRNDDKYIACEKKKTKTFSLNLIFSKNIK
jgi:hypothetical protein